MAESRSRIKPSETQSNARRFAKSMWRMGNAPRKSYSLNWKILRMSELFLVFRGLFFLLWEAGVGGRESNLANKNYLPNSPNLSKM